MNTTYSRPDALMGEAFYARLVEALRDRGLPTRQDAIAELLDVSQASVSKWLNNKAYPSRIVAARAAKLTNTSLGWLFFGTGAKRDASMDEYNWRLFKALELLTDEQRVDLLDITETWAKRAKKDGDGGVGGADGSFPKKADPDADDADFPH